MRIDVVGRLLSLLRGQWWLIAISVSCRVINQALGVVIPALAVTLALSAAEDGSPGLWPAVATLAALALFKGVFRYLEQFTGHGVAFRLLARLRIQVFQWLQRVEPAQLSDERSGDLVARISGDIDRVEPFYAHTIAPLVAAVVVPTLTLASLGVLVSPLVAIGLAPVVVLHLTVVPWVAWRRVAAVGPESRRLAGETAAIVGDVVQGAGEIAVLDASDAVLADVAEHDRRSGSVRGDLGRYSARRSLAGGALSGAALIAVVVVSAVADLPFRDLAISVIVAWTIMAPLRALEEIAPDTEQSLAAAARLFELEDLEPQTYGDAEAAPGVIRFETVTVVNGAQTILDSVDLTIDEGSFLGVVGPSGSGKTTLVSTLNRQIDPTSGRVAIGGRVLSDISDSGLKELVTVVPQRPDVFFGTVASNLRIARPEASEEEMRAALRRAGLLDWVDGLESGLDTPIGERGTGMSGGQLQRLAIARSFLKNPKVLILDEATSELDAATETAVLDEVYSERGERTLIVVAHRMETVVSADLIAVMDGGRLVELGTHETLRHSGGVYAALWDRHEDLLYAKETS